MLSFQTLDVYRLSIDFLVLSRHLVEAFPRGHGTLEEQLRRAAPSIPLNIADAQGRTGRADRARVYSIARGSAMECAAALDVAFALGLVDEATHQSGSALLERIVAMLTRMCR